LLHDDAKLARRMAPMLQKILIVDSVAASARMLGDLMRGLFASRLWTASSAARAMVLAEQVNPQLIFVEQGKVDGAAFTRQLRAGETLARQVPVIMVTASATAGAILAARDAGAHEVLGKPYTTRDVMRRLEAVTQRPRDWIEAVQYIGPDRRRFNSGDYSGARKRRSDGVAASDAERVLQALKILRSAMASLESEPRQALRAMLAQSLQLQASAAALADAPLAQATADLQRYLAMAADRGGMIPHEVAAKAAPLLARLPQDEPREVAAL